jgi:hypothetical protein
MTIPPANTILKYLVLVMLILATLVISSFFFGSSSFKDSDVLLEIKAPSQASSGDELVYEITYSNRTRTELKDLDILFFYPESSTVIRNGRPETPSTETFNVNSLLPGESGKQEIKVYLVGNRGDIKNAKVDMTFKAGSLRSSFEKSAAAATTITNVPVSLTLVAPPNATSGQDINYILDYRNETDDDINDLRLEFAYPDEFVPQSFNPDSSQGNNVWDVRTLRRGAGSRITISGIITGNQGESKIMTMKLKRKVGDQYVDYEKTSVTTSISSPLLGVNVFVNNSPDYSANIGEKLDYVIKFQNNSNYNLFGLTMTVKMEGDMYDFSTINVVNGLFDDSSKTAFWNAGTRQDFATFTPGNKGEVVFSIKLKPFFTTSVPGASRDKFVKATVEFSTPNVPQGIDGDKVSTTSTVITRISGQPSFNQLMYVNDADFGALGPFPPKAGQETALTVRWQISNPGNDVSNAEVSAVLPPGVIWMNNVKTGPGQPVPVYNPNTSTILWKIGTLPFGVGMGSPKYETAFQVKIRPATTQIEREIEVLKNTRFSGVDSFTKQNVIINKDLLDSNDTADRPGEGKVVQ